MHKAGLRDTRLGPTDAIALATQVVVGGVILVASHVIKATRWSPFLLQAASNVLPLSERRTGTEGDKHSADEEKEATSPPAVGPTATPGLQAVAKTVPPPCASCLTVRDDRWASTVSPACVRPRDALRPISQAQRGRAREVACRH